MCFGCSKQPSHWDGSFEYPQHMFWLRNKFFFSVSHFYLCACDIVYFFGRKMAAKQKHIQRVKQRILEKLKSLDDQEQAHYAVLHEHISKVGYCFKEFSTSKDP